jgi:kynurenine formamidase
MATRASACVSRRPDVAVAAALLALASAAACGRPGGSREPPKPAPAARIFDLGHPLAASDPTWSGEPAFSHTVLGTVEKGGFYAARFSADEHFGTHLDAPAHFAAGGWTVDKIPADRLVRPGVRISIEARSNADEDYRLTRGDLEAFERANGTIPEGAIVLVATGWDRRWPDAARYMNVRDGMKHFPGLSVEAASLLARERRVAGIGIDTASIDYGPSTSFEAHRTTQPQNVYHIENATGLTGLPASGFRVVVAPIKLFGGSGGPARVFALIPG